MRISEYDGSRNGIQPVRLLDKPLTTPFIFNLRERLPDEAADVPLIQFRFVDVNEVSRCHLVIGERKNAEDVIGTHGWNRCDNIPPTLPCSAASGERSDQSES